MRSRWEEGANAGLDEPVTLTERQLRSLKRGARAGRLALLLALAAAGLVGWSLFGGPIEFLGAELNPVKAQSEPAESGTAQTATTPSGGPVGMAPGSTPSAATAAQSTKPAAAAPQTRKPATAEVQTPTTEPAIAPTPTPVAPVTETPKPVAQDPPKSPGG